MAFFGWISLASSVQAGRKAGMICLRSMDVGEHWSKEKTWKVWTYLEESRFLGSHMEGKVASTWGLKEYEDF